MQHRRFGDALCAMIVKQHNGLQKQFNSEPDEYRILRCHGRFLNAELSEAA